MKVTINPGVYILAVSGGVDSVVLLDLLAKQEELRLVVAHFDHGIRDDSAADAEFVKNLAEKYGAVFESGRAELGKNASENEARIKRYAFLRKIKNQYQANAIITAHHQDDVIETMMINLLRGTSRRGLSSLKSSEALLRPLLGYSKKQIIAYAKSNYLQWREDSTNLDESYMRNYLRANVVSKLDDEQRREWLRINMDMLRINNDIDQLLEHLTPENNAIKRINLIQIPNSIACEIFANLFRKNNVVVSQKHVQDAVTFCKTARINSVKSLSKTAEMIARTQVVELVV